MLHCSSKKGALVTLRQALDLSYSDGWRFAGLNSTIPAIAISPDRKMYTCVRDAPNRISHASMKQVIGGLFSGHLRHWAETESAVITALIVESERFQERPTKSREYNLKMLRTCAARITEILKASLNDEVNCYIQHFASRLNDPKTDICWDQLSNNCQTFCKKLLSGSAFETIIPKENPASIKAGERPRYLLSFASERFGSLFDTERFKTTPSSEYLTEFHINEDEIEYFDTWPDIPRTKSCAKLLCWPCLNHETCTIGEHMWLMPHETISLLQLHIIRDRHQYRHNYTTQDPKEDEPAPLSDQEWFRNRLSVLLALDIFLGSAGALAASYQVLSEVRAEHQNPRHWEPQLVNDVGLYIRQPRREGESNFTIGAPRRSLLRSLFSNDRKMEKHLELTTTKKWSNFDNNSGKVPYAD